MARHLVSSLAFLAVSLALGACGGGGGADMPAPAAPQGGSATMQARSTLNASSTLAASVSREFNEPGNIVIADQFNNRVVEIDPPSHRVVWSFGGSAIAGPGTIVGTNDAERVGRFTLMAGTGVPAANPPFEPGCLNGCVDNRVILVNPHGKIVWQYGVAGVTGSGPNQLNTPVQSTFLPDRHVLITDQANERVIEVNRDKRIVWQYGTTGTVGNGPNQLSNPNSAELLENGDILIADENNNRVIEVNRAKQIVWQYPNPVDPSKINGAAFASRLENGNTLITDSNNNRVVEINHESEVVWTYSTLASGGNTNPLPTRAIRLHTGDTLISDQFNDRVIQVRKTGETTGTIVFTQGALNVRGDGFDKLNAPYDAKVVGDYTGLTPPFNDNVGDDLDPLRD